MAPSTIHSGMAWRTYVGGAAAAAAGPAEPARTPHIPPELLNSIFAWTGGPYVAAVSQESFENAELNRNDKWAEIYPQLLNDPLIAAYIAHLKLDNPWLIGREKFQRLFEAMIAELGIPESIKGLDRFSVHCYLKLSAELQDISLERAWGRMRDSLTAANAEALLPGLGARAAEIRIWLNNPGNNPVLGAVLDFDLRACDLLVIPNEMRKFPNLMTLDLSGNRIKVISSRQFEGFANLRRLYLHRNQLESLPADLFRGLANLQGIDLSDNQLESLSADLFRGLANLRTLCLNNNQLKSLLADLFRGLNNLLTIDLSYNQLESLSADLFRGLNNLQRIFLNSNQLKSLPADLFRGLVDLSLLHLENNQLESLPAGLFRGLADLFVLDLEDNQLENLPAGIFQDLAQLEALRLDRNSSDFHHFAEGFLDLSAQDQIAAIRNYYSERRRAVEAARLAYLVEE